AAEGRQVDGGVVAGSRRVLGEPQPGGGAGIDDGIVGPVVRQPADAGAAAVVVDQRLALREAVVVAEVDDVLQVAGTLGPVEGLRRRVDDVEPLVGSRPGPREGDGAAARGQGQLELRRVGRTDNGEVNLAAVQAADAGIAAAAV